MNPVVKEVSLAVKKMNPAVKKVSPEVKQVKLVVNKMNPVVKKVSPTTPPQKSPSISAKALQISAKARIEKLGPTMKTLRSKESEPHRKEMES